MTPETSGPEEVPGWAIRLEAKLDVALAQHGAQLDQHAHRISTAERRLQRIEEDPRVTPEQITDHETRIRLVEQKPSVSPKALGAALATVGGVVVAVTPFLDRLYT